MIWGVSVFSLAIGFKGSIAAILNYAFVCTFLGNAGPFEYHYDHTVVCISFLLMLVNHCNALSVDNLLKRSKKIPVYSIETLAIPFLGIGLIYFDSIFHKFDQVTWQNGLGIWLPASLPPYTWLPANFLQPLLNQKLLVIALSHGTLLFESIMIFLMLVPKTRILVAIVGMLLHIGIFVAFPIPIFAFGYISIYLLLLPERWFTQIESWIEAKLISAFPLPKTPQIKTGKYHSRLEAMRYSALLLSLVTIPAFQATHIVTNSPIGFKLFKNTSVYEGSKSFIESNYVILRDFLGVTPHSVFVDGHYRGYEHAIAIADGTDIRNSQLLPTMTLNGQSGKFQTGRTWAHWAFRTNSAGKLDMKVLENGLKSWVHFWIRNSGITSREFTVFAAHVSVPTQWSRDALLERSNPNWQIAGKLTKQGDEFIIDLIDIEEVIK